MLSFLYVLPNFGVGGLERGTVTLAQDAAKAGVRMIVVAIAEPRLHEDLTLLPLLRSSGIAYYCLGEQKPNVLSDVQRYRRARDKLIQVCCRERVDVLGSAILEADVLARSAARSINVPHICHLISTTYGGQARQYLRRRSRLLAKVVERLTSRTTDRYIALTDVVRQYAVEELGIKPNRIAVVPRGVEYRDLSGGRVNEIHASRERKRILSVGRLVPQKDHLTSIKAVAGLRDEGLSLSIYGEGPEEENLLAQAKHLDSVEFMGVVSSFGAQYKEYGIYLSAAICEGQSNALIEAMAAGCIPVVTDIPVFREVCGKEGVFFRPGDPADLRLKIRYVLELSEAESRRLSQAAQHRVIAHYSRADCSTRFFDVVKQVHLGVGTS